MNPPRSYAIALSASLMLLLSVAPVRAASLQKVSASDWAAGVNGLPSYVNMYIHVPDQRLTHSPIVVAPHHCQGSGTGTYDEMASLMTAASKTGFIMIFPKATGRNCRDAGTTKSLTHDAKGGTQAVAQLGRSVVRPS